jgi:uncharacterized membrane protein YiaA
MSLIKCPECSTEVSSLATACPKCAAPIAQKASAQAVGQQVTTTELTAKRLKKHMLYATGLLCVGVVTIIGAETGSSASAIGVLLCVAGFGWFLATRVRSWWHHG